MKNKNFLITDLDAEEQDLLNLYEQGKLKISLNNKEEKLKARIAASNYLKKDTRINIRISSSDLFRIKQKAAYEGLPYQTLISSILHKFSAGH